ncbi:MAG: hypothetical protein ABIG71_00115 [Candidatus Uhrbacteria bacterium]
MRYLFGFIFVGIGFLITWKSEWIFQNFGRVEWAEQHISGGTRIFWKLVGIGVILVSFLVLGGIIDRLLIFIFIR